MMLREDSVVIHDVVFTENAYFNRDAEASRPQPSPSMFKDDVFFKEIMESCDEICSPVKGSSIEVSNDVKEIISEMLEKITDTNHEVILDPLKLRSSSYKKALRRVHEYEDIDEFSGSVPDENISNHSLNPFKLNSSKNFSNNYLNPFSLNSSSVMSSSQLVMSTDAELLTSVENENISVDLELEEHISENNTNNLNICGDIDEGLLKAPIAKPSFPSNCKWQSTPVLLDNNSLDDDNAHKSVSEEEEGGDSSMPNALKVSHSYSPVYKMSFNSSFPNFPMLNYSFVNDRNDRNED